MSSRMFDTLKKSLASHLACPGLVCLVLIFCSASTLGVLYCPTAIQGVDYTATAELSYESMNGCLPTNFSLVRGGAGYDSNIVTCDLTIVTDSCTWDRGYTWLSKIFSFQTKVLGMNNGFQLKVTVTSANLSVLLNETFYLIWILCDGSVTYESCLIEIGDPINECTVYEPCVHPTDCIDGTVGYDCICVDGYTGINCSVGNEELNCQFAEINIPPYPPGDACFDSYVPCWVASRDSDRHLNLSVHTDQQIIPTYNVTTAINDERVYFYVCLTQNSVPGNYTYIYNISNDGEGQVFPVTLTGEILPYNNTAPKFFGAVNSSYFVNITESMAIGSKVLCVNTSSTEDARCSGDPSCALIVDPDTNKNFGIQSLQLEVTFTGPENKALKFIHDHTKTSLGCFYVERKLIPATTNRFELTVEDGGNKTTAVDILFVIVDVNDPPVCQTNSIKVGELSVLADNQNLTTLNCTDPDTEPQFREITYNVINYADYFCVSNTGILQVCSSLKTLLAGYYSFNITATGFSIHDDPEFTSVITVTFKITIPGPNCILLSPNYWPMRWQPSITEIYLILSCDTRDVGQLQIYSVDILPHSSTLGTAIFSKVFKQEYKTTGNLTLQLIKYEPGIYNVEVNATLGDEWSITEMRLPVFNSPNITTEDDIVRILSSTSVGSEIMTIHANTDVGGSFLTYSIAGGDTGNIFTIHNNGTVFLMKEISTDVKIFYRLTFEVKDSVSNLTAEKVIEIEIIPVSEFNKCIVLRSNISVYRPYDLNLVGYVVCSVPATDYSAKYRFSASSNWGLSVSDSGSIHVTGSPPVSVYAWHEEVIVSDNYSNLTISIKFKYYLDFNCDDSHNFCITLNADYCSDTSCTNCSDGWSGDDCSNDVDECMDYSPHGCLNYYMCENTNGSYKCLDSPSTQNITVPSTTATSLTTTSPTTTTEVTEYTNPNCSPNTADINSNVEVGYSIAKIDCKDQAGNPLLNFSVTTDSSSIKVNISSDGTIKLASSLKATVFTIFVNVTDGTKQYTHPVKCNITPVCPPLKEEDLKFETTVKGKSVSILCPSGYIGNVTRHCDDINTWSEFNLNNCVREDLNTTKNLVNQLKNLTLSKENVTSIVDKASNEMNSSFHNSAKIVSGDIKLVVNLFRDMTEAIKQKNASINPDILKSITFVCDKLVSANTSTWFQLDNENPAAGILESMETFTQASLNSWKDDAPIVMSNIVISCLSSSGDILFPKPDSSAGKSDWAFSNKIYLEKNDLQGNVNFSVLVYKNLAQFVKINASLQEIYKEGETLHNKTMNSHIVSFSMENKAIKKPVQLTFKLTQDNYSNPSCGFLDTNVSDDNVWSTRGCTLLRSNKTHVVCSCDHMTNFAVLMSTLASPDDSLALSIISAIGCAISIFCLVITIIVYIIIWKYVKNDRSVLHVNLSICLIIGYVVFLVGINRTDSEVGCKVVAVLLHFFFLVVFFTMLAEGIEILKSVSFVFTSKSILRYLLLVAYGSPLVIVAVSLGVKQTEGYGTKDFCWLSVDDGLIWAFVGPVLFVFLVNFIILIIVLKTMQTSQIMRDKSTKDRIKSVVRSISILSPILGLAWIFGVLSVNKETVVFQYLFAIFNSLQGLFVFIFQCLLQHQVKDGFKAMRRKYYAKSMDSGQRAVSGSSQSKGVSDSYSHSASNSNNVTHSTYALASPVREQPFAFHQYNNPAFQDNTDGKKSVKSNKSYSDNISRYSYEEDYRMVPASNEREDVYFYMGRTLFRDSRKEDRGEHYVDGGSPANNFSFPSPTFLDKGSSQEPIIYDRQRNSDETEDEHSENKSFGSNIIDKWRAFSRRRSNRRDENPEIEKERLRHVYGDVGTSNSLHYRAISADHDGNPNQIRAREHWKKVQDFTRSPLQNYPTNTMQTRNGNFSSSPYHGPVDGYQQTGTVKSRPNLTPLIIPRPSRVNKPGAQNYHSNI